MPILLLFLLATAPQHGDAKVREALGVLEKALVGKDEAVGELIELPRLLREMERRGTIPESNFRYRSARRLEDHLSAIVTAPGALQGGWNRIEPLNVRVNPGGDEAEALCRVTIGGKPCKFRVWLTRTGESWRTFDLEKLDGTYRLSVIGLQYTPGVHDDEDRQSLRDGVQTFQRAAMHLARGQFEGARDALAMARRSTPPEYVMDWIDLVDGQSLFGLGDLAAGLKAADRVLVRQKDLAVAHRLKAACHAALGDPAKAIAAGKDYLKLVGDDAEMWTLIGRASEELGQPDAALEAYRKGVEADAQDCASRLELGRLLLDRRRNDEAATHFTAAVGAAPAEDPVFERAADLLDRSGAHAEALALSDAAALRRADEAPVLLRRGRALRKLGRFKEAEETLRRATKLHLDEPDLVQELVQVLAQSGKDGEAQERMKTASDWSSAYVRAFVHAAAGRSDRALEELKAVFRAEPALPTSVAWIETEPVFEKVRGSGLVGSARAAREYWAARLNPRLPAEEMLRVATERIQAAPDHAVAYLDQGRALRRLKRPAEAEAPLRMAIEKSEDKIPAQVELGRTIAAQGRMDDALAVAEELTRAKPEVGMDLRAAVFALSGRREAALKALQSLLEKHPACHASALAGEDLDDFRRLPAVQESLRKARSRVKK